jgi:hypothetical protein
MIVDEGMIMYKGKYCPILQNMSKKPVCFSLEVWVATYALSKYLWKFGVYTERLEALRTVTGMILAQIMEDHAPKMTKCSAPKKKRVSIVEML